MRELLSKLMSRFSKPEENTVSTPAPVLIVDEAHHFSTSSTKRQRKPLTPKRAADHLGIDFRLFKSFEKEIEKEMDAESRAGGLTRMVLTFYGPAMTGRELTLEESQAIAHRILLPTFYEIIEKQGGPDNLTAKHRRAMSFIIQKFYHDVDDDDEAQAVIDDILLRYKYDTAKRSHIYGQLSAVLKTKLSWKEDA